MERISFDTTFRNKRSPYASVSCSQQYVMSGYLWSWGAQRSSISSHWTAVNTPNYLFSIALPKEIFVARERGLWYWCAFNVQKPRLYPSCPSPWPLAYWIELSVKFVYMSIQQWNTFEIESDPECAQKGGDLIFFILFNFF